MLRQQSLFADEELLLVAGAQYGMSGKGLAFLNKKGWHPGTLRNQEKVWKAEQSDLLEKKRVQEIRKQYEDERKIQELKSIRDAAHPELRRQERLDWMYEGFAAHAQQSNEEFLLGKPVEEKETPKEEEKKPGRLLEKADQLSGEEILSKLREDPLLLIKQQQKAALDQVKKNPVQMEKIKKIVEQKIKNDGHDNSGDEKKHKTKDINDKGEGRGYRRDYIPRSNGDPVPRRRSRSRSPKRRDTSRSPRRDSSLSRRDDRDSSPSRNWHRRDANRSPNSRRDASRSPRRNRDRRDAGDRDHSRESYKDREIHAKDERIKGRSHGRKSRMVSRRMGPGMTNEGTRPGGVMKRRETAAILTGEGIRVTGMVIRQPTGSNRR